MQVAGPINTPDEARMLEQAAYLTDLRTRLASIRGRRSGAVHEPRPPTRPQFYL